MNDHNNVRDMLADVCKIVTDQDVVIKTRTGEVLTVYEPVTIFKDFIRFQDSPIESGNFRTINVPFSEISVFSHP